MSSDERWGNSLVVGKVYFCSEKVGWELDVIGGGGEKLLRETGFFAMSVQHNQALKPSRSFTVWKYVKVTLKGEGLSVALLPQRKIVTLGKSLYFFLKLGWFTCLFHICKQGKLHLQTWESLDKTLQILGDVSKLRPFTVSPVYTKAVTKPTQSSPHQQETEGDSSWGQRERNH